MRQQLLIGSAAAAAVVLSTAAIVTVQPSSRAPGFAQNLALQDFNFASRQQFSRADLNRNEQLEEHEYVALAVVTSELAHLNGFLALQGVEKVNVLPLDKRAGQEFDSAERRRIASDARASFRQLSMGALSISEDQYIGARQSLFITFDQDGDNRLNGGDLDSFSIALIEPHYVEDPLSPAQNAEFDEAPFIGYFHVDAPADAPTVRDRLKRSRD